MTPIRQDYLLRQIQRIAAAVARLRAQLVGGVQAAEVLRAIREAEGDLLGERAGILRAVDASTAVQVVGRDDVLRQWVDVLRLEAEAHRLAGDETAARAADARAAALEQCRERKENPPPDGSRVNSG